MTEKPPGCGSYVLYALAAILGLYIGIAMMLKACSG